MFVKSLAAASVACAVLCGCAFAQGPTAQQGSRAPGAEGKGPGLARAEPAAELPPGMAVDYKGRPVVVEVFLSQSCKSSPPAAALLTHLAGRPDVVALGWHVDYWDKFAARKVGAWADPYARAAFAARQMAYNQRIKGRPMMMTPQAVIDGFISVAGSNRAAVERTILEAQFYDERARPTPPSVTVERVDGNSMRTRIDNVGAPYDAMVVSFRRSATTEIPAGDNAGVEFAEANVVRGLAPLASAHEGPGDFSFQSPPNGQGCAVLVQERGQGRIVAARYCAGE